jgi:hypothetical protein
MSAIFDTRPGGASSGTLMAEADRTIEEKYRVGRRTVSATVGVAAAAQGSAAPTGSRS